MNDKVLLLEKPPSQWARGLGSDGAQRQGKLDPREPVHLHGGVHRFDHEKKRLLFHDGPWSQSVEPWTCKFQTKGTTNVECVLFPNTRGSSGLATFVEPLRLDSDGVQVET